jgi:ABC-2 type transport system permease protein
MLRFEYLKMFSLRSTWWMLGATVFLMAGLSLLFAAIMNLVVNDEQMMADMGMGGGPTGEFPVGLVIVVFAYSFAQLTIAVFATLTITNEYSSGMIRSTFAATPRRLRTLWAKLIMVTVVTVIVSVISLVIAWLVTLPILNANDMTIDLSDATVWRSLVGVVLYLVMISWFALGIGTLMKGSAGGIATVMGVILVLPMILGMIVMFAPNIEWVGYIYRVLPSEAGQQIVMPPFQGGGGPGMGGISVEMLGPWTGFAVLSIYAVVAIIAAAFVIKKRDA